MHVYYTCIMQIPVHTPDKFCIHVIPVYDIVMSRAIIPQALIISVYMFAYNIILHVSK